MKTYIYPCLATLAAFPAALGLGLGDIPKCAQPCANDLPSECNVLDVSCICKSSTWISGISCCVKTKCSEDDQQKTIEVAANLCKLYTTLPTAAICPASAATTAPITAQSSSAGSSSTGSSSPTGSAASEQSSSSSVSAGSKTATTTTAATTNPPASLTATRSSSSPAAVQSGAAAGHPLGQGIGAAGAAVFALALL